MAAWLETGSAATFAVAGDRGAGVKSLRRDRYSTEETCWLHGDDWCLSCRENAPPQR
jgi:hypothetical protein